MKKQFQMVDMDLGATSKGPSVQGSPRPTTRWASACLMAKEGSPCN